MTILPATRADQLQHIRQLFEEYAASLSFSLCFQNFQQELDGLPGDYAPPGGSLWLATTDGGEAVGCVALRRLEPGVGEMKRLYVRPEHRETGLGKRLALTVLKEAGSIGYRHVRLDTTPEMAVAIRLYESLGFTRTAPHRPNPVEGAIDMEIRIMQQSEYMAMMQGDDGTLGSAELVAAYEQGIDELRSAVAGMTSEQVLARPVPGKWSTIECVGHLADTEIFFTDRIVRTIALDRPLLMSADEKLYIERLNYQSFDLAEQLALFTALRRHAARILRSQPPESWSRTAVHSGSGLLTLRQLVLQAVRHLRHHLPFIAEKRAALGAGQP